VDAIVTLEFDEQQDGALSVLLGVDVPATGYRYHVSKPAVWPAAPVPNLSFRVGGGTAASVGLLVGGLAWRQSSPRAGLAVTVDIFLGALVKGMDLGAHGRVQLVQVGVLIPARAPAEDAAKNKGADSHAGVPHLRMPE
jgi:hypothetical protein